VKTKRIASRLVVGHREDTVAVTLSGSHRTAYSCHEMATSYQKLRAELDLREAYDAHEADKSPLNKARLAAAVLKYGEIRGAIDPDSLQGGIAKAFLAGNQVAAPLVTAEVAKAARDNPTGDGALVAKALMTRANSGRSVNLAKASDFGHEPAGATHDLTERVRTRKAKADRAGKNALDMEDS
jgi:hypothetical protein